MLALAGDALPWQRSLRWAPPPRDRWVFFTGLAIAIVLTLVELVGFGVGMEAHWTRPGYGTPIRVAVIENPVERPLPPEPVPPPLRTRPSTIRVAPPKVRLAPPPPVKSTDDNAVRARIGEGSSASAPRLFNPDGSVRLAPGTVGPAKPETPLEAGKARWAEIEHRGKNPLDCRRSVFAQGYRPDESLGSGIARKYLSWIGLYDPHETEKRAQRAAEGCPPGEP